jgi:thiol-disulfide isomerase/thioredoxin
MKNFLLGVCVVFALVWAYNRFKPAHRFTGGADTIPVERLTSAGKIVEENFQPRQAPYLAVYHGASWCGPCQAFSPRLCDFYNASTKQRDRFQLLMVNYDRSEPDMAGYMREHKMAFPAVMREHAGDWGVSTGQGIPNLVIIDTATGKVVSSSFDGSTYVGCDVPLRTLMTILVQGHP